MEQSPLTRRRLIALAGGLTLSAVIAACAGRDESTGAGPSGASDATAGDPEAAAARGDVTIDMKYVKYIPAAATAKVGNKIVWTNSDTMAHTVTKTGGPGPGFDSGTIPPGGTYELTVKASGKIDYICTIHPNQTGTLTVQ